MLTNEQDYVVRQMLKNRHCVQVQTLGGYAGTGKTTCLQTLAEKLPDYEVVAYTGKAADVLRRRGTMARTIHSAIYHPVATEVWVPDPAGSGRGRRVTRTQWVLKNREQLACAGFLVDEASMIHRQLYDDLLSFELPLMFVGDHGQLEPIGDDIYLMRDPMYRLETIHRNAGPIAHFAEHLRNGRSPGSFQGSGNQVRILTGVHDYLLTQVDQVIVGFNTTRVGLNQRVRHLLHLPEEPAVGDRIICLRNKHPLGVFNGMQGIVTRLYPGDPPQMDFVTSGVSYHRIEYDPEQFHKKTYEYQRFGTNPFDYAYALTAHKSQGSEWDSILVYEEVWDKWDVNRWCYTAASRARDKLYWKANGWTKRSRVVVEKEVACQGS